jgi:hypothetical protein
MPRTTWWMPFLAISSRWSRTLGTKHSRRSLQDEPSIKVIEPVIVVAIVAGLIALFFQNRP